MKPLTTEKIKGQNGEDIVIWGDEQTLTQVPTDYQGAYEVPEGITWIGVDAIRSCDGITSVFIPKSVRRIDMRNFGFCDSLTSIVVDKDNPVFDSRDNCNAIILTATNTLIQGCNGTTIPEGVEVIAEDAFVGCYLLQSLRIPASVKYLEPRFLDYCPSLASLSVDENNPVYDSRNDCNAIIETETDTLLYCATLVESFVIPIGVRHIGDGAFKGCRILKFVYIPHSVTSIGEDAFMNCNSLEGEIDLTGIGLVGNDAFDDCSHLTKVTIGWGLRKISRGAFCSCINLKELSITGDVREIESWAFGRCDNLESITLPASIERIEPTAFIECNRISKVYIPKGTSEHFGSFEALKKYRHHFIEYKPKNENE